MSETTTDLVVSSPVLVYGRIPEKYTGDGEDVSPPLVLSELSSKAKSLAVIMDDLNNPLFGVYNHWVIWNLPPSQMIPEQILPGNLESGAIQGIGYGRHRYRGPKPIFHQTHRYQFNVYVLDCTLNLKDKAKKNDLLKAMAGHILQYGFVIGHYK